MEVFARQLFKKLGDAGFFEVPFARKDGGEGLQNPALPTRVMPGEVAFF